MPALTKLGERRLRTETLISCVQAIDALGLAGSCEVRRLAVARAAWRQRRAVEAVEVSRLPVGRLAAFTRSSSRPSRGQ